MFNNIDRDFESAAREAFDAQLMEMWQDHQHQLEQMDQADDQFLSNMELLEEEISARGL